MTLMGISDKISPGEYAAVFRPFGRIVFGKQYNLVL